MDRQTLRDWVHRYNAQGVAGLRDRKAPGAKPKLSAEQEAEVASWVRSGPDLSEDGVVRWRRCDLARKIERPFGVVLAERSVGGIDRQLYLPKDWTGNHFNSWSPTLSVSGTAEKIARELPAESWIRLSAGNGTKGPRLYDWAYLELADFDPEMVGAPPGLGLWTRGLLVRRRPVDGELAFFTTWCRHGTPVDTLVRVEGQRWSIEDTFETAKTELGLDHDETRSWHGWHRHVSLIMLAFALLAVVRHKADTLTTPPKTMRKVPPLWSVGRCRRSVMLPTA